VGRVPRAVRLALAALVLAGAGASWARPRATRDEPAIQAPQSDLPAFRAALRAVEADPESVARLLAHALLVHSQDARLGDAMLVLLLPEDASIPDPKAEGGRVLRLARRTEADVVAEQPAIARGFCGGTPEQDYADADLRSCPVTLDRGYSASRQGVGYPRDGEAKFFLVHPGATRPRPLTLLRVGTVWRIKDFGGLLTDVRRKTD